MTGALLSHITRVGGSALLLLLLLLILLLLLLLLGKREGQEARPETLLIPTDPLAFDALPEDAAAATAGSIIIACIYTTT